MHQKPNNKTGTPQEQLETMPGPILNNENSQPENLTDSPVLDPQQIEEERLKAYAHLLDSGIRLPGGFRIGIDGIIGLIPGIGDLLGAGLSGYFIYAASRLDIPRHVIARMILNTAIETIVGAIPFIGDAFDFVFKANERNARLLRRSLEAREIDQKSGDAEN